MHSWTHAASVLQVGELWAAVAKFHLAEQLSGGRRGRRSEALALLGQLAASVRTRTHTPR